MVVFGAYSTWTYDMPLEPQPIIDSHLNETSGINLSTDLELQGNLLAIPDLDYCAYPPFMCAFALLIISWTLVPVILVLMCFCGLCAAVTMCAS